jgi:hypothetical protein
VSADDQTVAEDTVEPIAGRTLIFTSDHENPHYVERLESGERFVLAFWFTCDAAREFEIFLDGKAHTTFSHTVKNSILRQQQKQQEQQQQQQQQQQEVDEDITSKELPRKKRHRKKSSYKSSGSSEEL